MKQQDIALIIVIIVISAAASIFISKSIIVPPKNRQQQVEVVQPISTNFPLPDNRFYNSSSFDPSNSISINEFNNSNPFNNPTNNNQSP